MTGSRRKALFKVMVLGDAGVGKTSLLNQYVNRTFSDQYKATIGADFLAKDVVINDRIVTMQIWDTAGQERFRSLCPAFYRAADCCVLVFDVTNVSSFHALEKWREEFLTHVNPPDPEHFPFVVLANKVDMEEFRTVPARKAQTWCIVNNNMPFFQVSAKEAFNVDKAFQAVARCALESERAGDPNDFPQFADTVHLKASKRAIKSSDCCI